jgi:hypothetical protein
MNNPFDSLILSSSSSSSDDLHQPLLSPTTINNNNTNDENKTSTTNTKSNTKDEPLRGKFAQRPENTNTNTKKQQSSGAGGGTFDVINNKTTNKTRHHPDGRPLIEIALHKTDTLQGLALTYDCTIEFLKRVNFLSNDRLISTSTLWVPQPKSDLPPRLDDQSDTTEPSPLVLEMFTKLAKPIEITTADAAVYIGTSKTIGEALKNVKLDGEWEKNFLKEQKKLKQKEKTLGKRLKKMAKTVGSWLS